MNKREKNFSPEFRSYSTQARKFRKIEQKIEKIKKPLSDIIFSENGMRYAEKVGKKIYSRMPFVLDPGKKIPIKIVRKLKKLKNHFPTFFLAKMAKKLKKLKNLFPTLFLAKTG